MMKSYFDALGGEDSIRQLVDRFYDHMDSRDDTVGIRKMHPDDLTSSRDKLYMFVVGWTGGPPLYMQTYGHPRLRMRHLPFAIGDAERDQWMLCMQLALNETVEDEGLRKELYSSFHHLATHMKNQAE
jgi:hemoglobin